MAYREKVAWITLATTLLVYGGYFTYVGPWLLARDGTPDLAFFEPLTIAVVVIILLQGGLTAIAAALDPVAARAPRDEREQLIALRGNRAGFYTLQIGTFAGITTLFWQWDAAVIANLFFLAMGVGECVRAASQAIEHRRDACLSRS